MQLPTRILTIGMLSPFNANDTHHPLAQSTYIPFISPSNWIMCSSTLYPIIFFLYLIILLMLQLRLYLSREVPHANKQIISARIENSHVSLRCISLLHHNNMINSTIMINSHTTFLLTKCYTLKHSSYFFNYNGKVLPRFTSAKVQFCVGSRQFYAKITV